ncbi:MAG TPA: tetratricopeptide repeat protein [Solirubrobacteraceae bacterium]|nr:tetratricopeptide repeat protein [Solirubrobacteraceae bacterium]
MTKDGLESVVARAAAVVARYGKSLDARERGLAATAMVDQAVALIGLGRGDEALACLEQVLQEFRGALDLGSQVTLANAMGSVAREAVKAGEFDQAVALLGRLGTQFGDATDPDLRHAVVSGSEECARACDAVIERDSSDDTEAGQARVVDAMWIKSRSFATAGDTEKELAALERLVARFGGSAERQTRLTVARAYYNMGGLHRDWGRTDEALRAWDQVIEHVDAGPPPGVPTIVIDALCGKANYLVRLDRLDDAITTCDVLLDRCGEDPPAEDSDLGRAGDGDATPRIDGGRSERVGAGCRG